MSTYLCAAIFVTDIATARRDIALAAEAGADMAELRIDALQSLEDRAGEISALITSAVIPCIVTCRPTWEGGRSTLPDSDRVQLVVRVLAFAERLPWMDIELKTVEKLDFQFPEVPGEDSRLIISSHDFQSRPARLYNLLEEMNARGSQINKIVWTARTIRDNLEAFEILQQRSKPTIALCMGEAGLISRVLAKKFGGFLTFASLKSDSGTAPGQLTIDELKQLYRWDKLGASTRVFGVVANPVRHSMSPAIHNAAFDATGYDGIYLPLLVESSYESFKAFMETFVNFPGLDLSGLSITIPHKENALRYLREKNAEIEPLAQRIGAVNTLSIQRGEAVVKFRGTNTDYAAILDCITDALGSDRAALRGLRVGVLGAGGTGRTAVAALAEYGAEVRLTNRTPDRAAALAEEFSTSAGHVAAVSLKELAALELDVIINTTSVGMHPHIAGTPWGDFSPKITAKTIVFDTVYNPMETRFLRDAKGAGARTIAGIEMFLRQAVAQFETWTGTPAPRAAMRQVIEDRLAKAQETGPSPGTPGEG